MKRRIVSSLMILSLMASSCDSYDDSELVDRVESLEEWKTSIEEEIKTLQDLVSALQSNVFITEVDELTDGYKITFSNGTVATISDGEKGDDGTPGENGTPGAAGSDGTSSLISVQAIDGVYYWTLNGAYITDGDGEKLAVTGSTPYIEDGYWFVDGTSTGVAAQGDSFFQSVETSNAEYVIFTLADGTEITIPRYVDLTPSFDSYDVTITPVEKSISINLPATVTQSNYLAIKAELLDSEGNTQTSFVTRTSALQWSIAINKPTFDTDGTYNGDASIELECNVDGATALLKVILIDSEGNEYSKTLSVSYTSAIVLSTSAAGELSTILSDNAAAISTYGQITVNGEINGDDIDALRTCSGLTSIDLSGATIKGEILTEDDGNGTTVYVTDNAIKKHAFEGMTSLTKIVLPENLTVIGQSAFYGCSSLAEVVIPSSLEQINRWVFQDCSSLSTVELNEGLQTLLPSAFYGCGVTSITIPSTVSELPNWAFQGCLSLSTIDFGNITSIGNFALYNTNISVYDIPEGVTHLGSATFLKDDIEVMFTESVVTLPSTLVSITGTTDDNESLSWAGTFCEAKIETLSIPSGVTVIPAQAFRGAEITTLALNDKITTIGSYAFSSISNLESFTVPALVEELKVGTFAGSMHLKSIDFANVKTLGESVIYYCDNLDNITLGATTISESAFFTTTSSVLTSITLTSGTVAEFVATTNHQVNLPMNGYSGSVNCDFDYSTIKLYVPAELVDEYKASAFVNGFGDSATSKYFSASNIIAITE